jgi:hypothetical protein
VVTRQCSSLIAAPTDYMGMAATVEFMRGWPQRVARVLAVARYLAQLSLLAPSGDDFGGVKV